mmetsp:Transcript_13680/g.18339  ORF Transcript_13680/g.18339 Transcript_13680/m.18339 type:complete len:345 (-) Transcript_13680:94-1128(-)
MVMEQNEIRQNRAGKRVFGILAMLTVTAVSVLDLPVSTTIRCLSRRAKMTGVAKGAALDELFQANLGDIINLMIKENDTPLYLHIPKAGGTAVIDYYRCLGLVTSENLYISEGRSHIMLETHSVEGIHQAKDLEIVQRGLADVIFTPLLPAAMEMFDSNHQARVFALFRHPIDREVSLYYYRQIADWEGDGVYAPELANTPIETYFEQLKDRTDNFMISVLLNKDRKTESITEEDLEYAKQILRNKVLIGLTSNMEESIQRFDIYFGWTEDTKHHGDPRYNAKRSICQKDFITKKTNSNPHEPVEKGSLVWEYLSNILYYDIQLYEYAVELFEEQTFLFEGQDS